MTKETSEELPGVEGPGVSRPKIKAIETAAADYVIDRDKRMKMTEKEVAAKKNLITVMEKHLDKLVPDDDGVYHYLYDDLEILFSKKENVKVRTAGSHGKEE